MATQPLPEVRFLRVRVHTKDALASLFTVSEHVHLFSGQGTSCEHRFQGEREPYLIRPLVRGAGFNQNPAAMGRGGHVDQPKG